MSSPLPPTPSIPCAPRIGDQAVVNLDPEARIAETKPVARSPAPPWTALIVDDDPAVHEVTRILLARTSFENRSVVLHHAYSGKEARAFLDRHPETALVLLDVVMETDDAGLRLCGHIRETLGNHDIQIVLRTGQPGQAPEREVILNYEINGYFLKTELTAQKLHSIIICALRTWNYIKSLKRQRGVARTRFAQAREPAGPAGVTGALDRGEVEVLAQPQLDLQHGTLAGVELIPKWRGDGEHEIRGASLLRAADREGESGRINRWLITEGCRLALRWCTGARSVSRVSLKASGAAIRSGGVVAAIQRCLETTNLSPRCLALEIPESELSLDLGASAKTVDRLQELGVAIIVDEFGIGPTSIAELRQLGPVSLQIAPEIVAGVASDPDCAAVARSVIALAHTLGMSVNAEGVETKEQLEFLKWENCESAQGDFFAEAMAPALLDAFVDSDWKGPKT